MNEPLETEAERKQEQQLSLVLIKLMKGVLALDEDEILWQGLLRLQTAVSDYVGILGLELVINEEEGLAWLKTAPPKTEKAALPRLINKRPLSYPVSLLLVLLRRKLVEHDAQSGEERLILSKEDLIEQLRVFLPLQTNEAKFMDQLETHINKIIDLGFIRRLDNSNAQLEVRRIIKAFVDAQWLHDFEQRMREYVEYLEEIVK